MKLHYYPESGTAYFTGQTFRVSSSEHTETELMEISPRNFELNQNYPNPFNPTTEISFNMEKPGHVNLEIYNIIGQKVKTLVDRHMDTGTHSVEWDASNCASGIYFYKITINGVSQSQKMLLTK
jgi:flagellar hook assembly protein FlgD